MLIALTRPVSPTIGDCALTFMERQRIDPARAEQQHQAYEACLRRMSVQVVSLPPAPDLPDAVFVEDTAVVVDEVAVMAAPPLALRRQEVASVGDILSRYREMRSIEGSATLEGGDVLRVGRTLYVGLSARTNREGVEQLATILRPYDYQIRAVRFDGCLHLKSACTYVGRGTLLINRAWLDPGEIGEFATIEVVEDEPHAANVLAVGETLLMPASFPQTRARLERAGFQVMTVNLSELQKAEAGVTCCSILLQE